ncbi:MAG TPA: nucleotidyltransferase domain-containing protein [Candidatus Kapabacteria bacterium]|nr:nucleotidyltransferase domain-containing protein [Candidatus Kapabacteria bacterium]HPO62062.1 nucleotidyltransferase domain-containing protein [Candidatus Kapabacteria bacterium]
MLNKTDILKIKDLILEIIDSTENILLFGSYARGNAVEESDIDIAVLVNHSFEPKWKLEKLLSLRKKLALLSFNADIILKEKSTFLNEINLPTLSRVINQEGKYLWSKV